MHQKSPLPRHRVMPEPAGRLPQSCASCSRDRSSCCRLRLSFGPWGGRWVCCKNSRLSCRTLASEVCTRKKGTEALLHSPTLEKKEFKPPSPASKRDGVQLTEHLSQEASWALGVIETATMPCSRVSEETVTRLASSNLRHL